MTRTLALGDREWTVTVAAERCPGSNDWTLVAGFRSAAPEPRRLWIPLPITSSSKAVVFAEADALSVDQLAGVLRARLAM